MLGTLQMMDKSSVGVDPMNVTVTIMGMLVVDA